MQETRSNTVILAFVRSPQEEARCKPLLQQASYARRLRLARLLNERACKVARQTGLPLLVIDSKQQQGQGFGQRFANALQQAFDQGYERVIALGNDCLQLAPEHLLQAEKGLQMAPIVLGPATDGGIYLLGLHRHAFDPISLIDRPGSSQAYSAACWATPKPRSCPALCCPMRTMPIRLLPFWRLCADSRFPRSSSNCFASLSELLSRSTLAIRLNR